MLRLVSWLLPIVALLGAAAMQLLKPRNYVDKTAVKIVDIDDASLARIGQWPWPRDMLADMLNKLTEQGASSVVFDIAFPEPDRAAPRRYLEKWQSNPEIARLIYQLPDTDLVFAAALKTSPSVTGSDPSPV